MKHLSLFLAISAIACAQNGGYVNFIRQIQQGTGIVWDRQVAPTGEALSELATESNGSLFQLWTIDQTKGQDYLIDQKLVGNYLPAAELKITTLDPNGRMPRTRVDQPFTVEINVAGLLTGCDFPLTASKILLEQHTASYPTGQSSLDPTKVLANAPFASGYIGDNGRTVLKFPASSLKASDPTKAIGEEHFVVHALMEGRASQTQIASASVQVWPIASGEIKGITNGDVIRSRTPEIELTLTDLYPRSDTSFMLYEGTSVNGVPGTLVKFYPINRDASASTVIGLTDLDSKFTKDGTYTVALMSETVYGTELLCAPITFQVKRPLQSDAMQVSAFDRKAP